MSCPAGVDSCAYCAGSACHACMLEPIVQICTHDAIERHKGLPALSRATTRPTAKMERIALGRIEVEFSDGESVAEFLDLVARIARTKKRIVIIVE